MLDDNNKSMVYLASALTSTMLVVTKNKSCSYVGAILAIVTGSYGIISGVKDIIKSLK